MLYDRPYMQASSDRRGPSALSWLIIAVASVFLGTRLLSVFLPDTNLVYTLHDLFGMSRNNFRSGRIWSIFTYSFFHGSLFHVGINLLIIYGIGRSLQAELGEKQFLYLYSIGVLLGGITVFILDLNGSGITVGASAGALAMITVYCFQRWEMPVTLLFLEITFKMKWLFFAILAWDALGYLLPLLSQISSMGSGAPGGGTSHTAHLGGILGGFLYYKYLMGNQFNPGGLSQDAVSMPKWFSKKASKPKPSVTPTPKKPRGVGKMDRKGLQAEVDRILDKINSEGFGSLSDEEKKTLDRARDILSR